MEHLAAVGLGQPLGQRWGGYPPNLLVPPRPKLKESTMQQFQGKNVKTMRDAKDGDPGYVKGTDQIVITLEDGTEKTVKRKELTEVHGQSQGQQQP